MKSTLLTIGGIFQMLIVLLHIGIFYGIASSPDLGADAKVTAHIFNAAVLTTVIFFAYVSLFRKRDMIGTTFGRIVSGFIAIFYLQRGLVEIFLRGVDPVVLGFAIVIPPLYAIVAMPSKQKAEIA